MSAEPRRVLIATLAISGRFGTDLYTRDLALAVLRRGWLPVIYTTLVGEPAAALRRASIPVIHDIDVIGARPDIIHGHHTLETMTALAKFPDVPALFVCHDSLTWHSVPPVSHRIRTWVAVDRNCRDRMIFEHGVPPESVRVLLNAVDLERFRRRAPLPARPRRALVFGNSATENGYAAPIVEACERRGIEIHLAGLSSGKPATDPETLLPEYDLVFAKARCALEAAAVGTSVVVCDSRGLAGMMTTSSVDAMRQLNFGARTLQRPITAGTIGEEIDRYDAADAAAVCDRIRASADVDLLAQQYIAIYEELCNTPVDVSPARDMQDLARSLSQLTRRLHNGQAAPSSRMLRLRTAILNSRVLGLPVRLAYRLKKRFEL